MVDKSRMTLQKLARWHPSQSSTVHDRKGAATLWEGTLQPYNHEDLEQGALYIIKIHHVSVGLFQGWNDDMCCFAVLRSENMPMRWSQARYLPGDFDAYDAFDEAGNPPVHLWTRSLRVEVPTNWFSIFEEARRKQREWRAHVLGHHHLQSSSHHHHHHSVNPTAATGVAPPSTTTAAVAGATMNEGYPLPLHHPHGQPLEEDFSEGTFSAAPSHSIRSERLSSISSLPLDSRPEDGSLSFPTVTATAAANLTDAYSPPQSPISSTATSASRYPPLTITDQSSSNQPSTAATTASILTKEKTKVNQREGRDDPDRDVDKHDAGQSRQYATSKVASSSSPTVISTGSTTQAPALPPTAAANNTTKTTKRRSNVGATPSQQLELALGDISFPHDDDRFSIHSGYQAGVTISPTQAQSPQVQAQAQPAYPDTTTWKKRSLKRMLRRSSQGTK